MYSTELCVYCQSQKQFLNDHHIPFKEVRVDNDAAAAEAMIKQSGQMGVPYTVITNEEDDTKHQVIGFDRKRLTKILGI